MDAVERRLDSGRGIADEPPFIGSEVCLSGPIDVFPATPVSGALAALCAHRPFTPSTALRKFDDPEASVREIASLVGASCSWRLRSCKPSCRRNPMSSTTLGLPLHGCRASTISKTIGSVMRFQTSNAFVFLNSAIHCGLKSMSALASPPSVLQLTLVDISTERNVQRHTSGSDHNIILRPFPKKLRVFDGGQGCSDIFLELDVHFR